MPRRLKRAPGAALLLTAALAPGAAPAGGGGPQWVNDTALCAALRAGAGIEDAAGDGGGLILSAQAITGMEYHCAFDPPLDMAAPDQTITTHSGYCEEPGLLTPQLFTFRIERLESPRATLYDGTDTPTVFQPCP